MERCWDTVSNVCMASSLPEAPTACRCGCQQGSHWHPLSEIKVGVGRWFYLCARICFKSRPVQPVSTQVTQKQLQLHFLFLTHNSSEGEYLGQQNKTFRCYTDTVTVPVSRPATSLNLLHCALVATHLASSSRVTSCFPQCTQP